MSYPYSIAVVVPTCRRNDLLLRCLSALVAQDLSADAYEIVVADDGAERDTEWLVEQFASRVHVRIRYVRPETKGPAAARNAGWRAAEAEIIAFTDDDCIPSPSWLSEGLLALEDDVDAASGKLVFPLSENPTDYERNAAQLARAEFVTANCFYRRRALEQIDGFDERFATAWREDSDLYFALIESNGRCRLANHAVVVHPVRPAPWGVSVLQQKKTFYNALLYKKHPDLYRRYIQPAPPWPYYGALAGLLFALAGWLIGSHAILIAGISIWIACTAGFCVRRLMRTSHAPSHIAEMIVTSILIPPLAVFWRLTGAIRFRVFFL